MLKRADVIISLFAWLSRVLVIELIHDFMLEISFQLLTKRHGNIIDESYHVGYNLFIKQFLYEV